MRKTDYSVLAERYAAHRRVNPRVAELLANTVHHGARVMEVGCGTGNYLAAVCGLSRAGARVQGFDVTNHSDGTLASPG